MFDYSIRDRLDYYGLIIYQLLIIYLKQEIELLIPAQTGNGIKNVYRYEDNLKNESGLKYEDDLKNEDDLKIEDYLKNEDNLKNEDSLKKEKKKLFLSSKRKFALPPLKRICPEILFDDLSPQQPRDN